MLSVVVNFVFKYASLKLPFVSGKYEEKELGREFQRKDRFRAYEDPKGDGRGMGGESFPFCVTPEKSHIAIMVLPWGTSSLIM